MPLPVHIPTGVTTVLTSSTVDTVCLLLNFIGMESCSRNWAWLLLLMMFQHQKGIVCFFNDCLFFFLITKVILVIVEMIQSTNEQKTMDIAFLSTSKESLFFDYDS